MKKQWVLAVVLCLALLTVIQQLTTTNKQLPKKGYTAPAFTLTALNGQSYSLDSLNGKPVLINFWASWCEPCQAEAPEFSRLYELYKDQIEILAVNVTSKDRVDDAQVFVSKYHIPFPVLLDAKAAVTETYNIAAIPTTYFVDRNGIIVDRLVGTTDPKQLELKFKQLLR
ncbi:TlpA disulfide reductase family protein [Paenibacillus sp. FSL H7-0331]|uniref:TlpA family protein disulfide reductase n=1 Tax=Paenibacillus sp. FSL H7-0331 TaxID=1920421 RepID=UPI00096CD219|nr:TlpA disulfide reductase family protein [Paenibacillus sp. FSL H7-0331]OMF19973.1 thiol:disulfide interchange protein [Paenibacillus sp. FSL H7-0331]